MAWDFLPIVDRSQVLRNPPPSSRIALPTWSAVWLGSLVLALTSVSAGELPSGAIKRVEPVAPPSATGSVYDRIWDMATLYRSAHNPVLQELALQGRLQLQYATGPGFTSGDLPDSQTWGDVDARQWHLGLVSRWFRHFTLQGQISINPNFDPQFYQQIFDLNLNWSRSEAFSIGVGKYRANLFGLEQLTSSRYILTFERSLLSKALLPGELTGTQVRGRLGNWLYAMGVYASDIQAEFSQFDSGMIVQAGIGYDLTSMTGMEKGIVKLDWQHSTDAENGGSGAVFEHAVSINSVWEKGRFGLNTDVLGGIGQGSQSDVWGFYLIPTFYLEEHLQLVMRYHYASGGHDGLRLPSRYERLDKGVTDGGRGDEFQAVYLGLNYYLYGHKLKLMAGAEYSTMEGGGDGGDFNGWTGLVGLRMFF